MSPSVHLSTFVSSVSEICLISISTSVNLDLIVWFVPLVILFVLHLSVHLLQQFIWFCRLSNDSSVHWLSGVSHLSCLSVAEFDLLEVLAVHKTGPRVSVMALRRGGLSS